MAAEFLRRARLDGASVILNGDVFDDLFEGSRRCQRAHPEVSAEIEALSAMGRLRRTRGNHDPDAGEERIVLDWPGVGRVLVAHGDAADPVNRSWLGRLGDGISRRFGRLGLVRGAATLAAAAATAAAGGRIARVFRARCLELVAREGCNLGVFGHTHAPHLTPGDRYANAGSLAGEGLQYLELGPGGLRLCTLTPQALAAGGRGRE
jgi:UDP-2,3-diacylglucosamine pyrophosphatase LpxH